MPKFSVAVVAGAQLADYHFGEEHVFGPHRQQAFLDGMDRLGLTAKVTWLDPVRCELQSLQSFHDDELIEMVRQHSESGVGLLDDGDTPARKGIFEAGCTVIGSVLKMIDEIMSGQFRRGFVPIAGLHHAYRDRCSGFCVFNDCALAIEYLRRQHHLQKILYVDMDAHHGNGVFYSYESDRQLFIVDFHEDGRYLYPGSGDIDETGLGSARGTKINFSMPPGAGDEEFARAWSEAELFMERVQPEFIIFQCGADSMQGDPITHLEYSTRSYRLAAEHLCRIADKYCEGRMLALGGGGYNLQNISSAWPTVVRAML